MEQILLGDVPHLTPMWHGLSLQDVVQHKQLKRYTQDKLPDYGGVGIDINISDSDVKCQKMKHTVDQVPFNAHTCALPFLPPNKISLKTEPCLMPLKASKVKFERFCVTLESLRRSVNKTNGKIKQEILSAHKMAKKVCSTGKFRKFPILDSVMQLATEFPKSDILPTDNFDYLGGCLASSQTVDGIHILLYPTGKKLTKLALTTVDETCDSNKTFKAIDTKTIIMLKSGCIEKIKSAVPGYCFVQQGRVCHFVNFTDTANISECHCTQLKNTINFAGSPYNPIEVVSINDTGNLELHDIETKQSLWISNNSPFVESLRGSGPLACDFGPHPKSVLSLTDKYVHSYDLRLEENNKSVIFSSGHFSSFREERLMTLKNLIVNPFQHLISSTHHLYVCDDRYPSKPVLMWNHLLKSSPFYCDITTYDSNFDSKDFVIILGTQKSREIVSFAVRSQYPQIQPISLNPPLFLSSPYDSVSSLKFHGIFVNDNIEERLSYPLVGACAIAHCRKKGFTAFQISSFGDLFFQDFEANFNNNVSRCKEQTHCVDTGCVLVSPDRILPHLSKWTNVSIKNAESELTYRSNLNGISVDLKEILIGISDEGSSGHCFCQSNIYNRPEDGVSTPSCCLCGLDTVQSEKLTDAFKNLSLLSGPLCENSELTSFDINSLSQFTDNYNMKILKPWVSTEDVDMATQKHNINLDPIQFPPISSESFLDRTISDQRFNDSIQQEFAHDTTSQQSNLEISFMDKSDPDLPPNSQEYLEDFVPPSQDFRPIIGETLRISDKSKKLLHKKKSSVAGF